MHWWEKAELEEKVTDLMMLNLRLQQAVLKLERERDKVEGERNLLYDLYDELKGCKWIREDGGENQLAITMANLERCYRVDGEAKCSST